MMFQFVKEKSRRYLLFSLIAIAFGGSITVAQASDLSDPQQIVNKANMAHFYPAKDGRGEIRMKIVDQRDRKQWRQFTMLRRNKGEVAESGGDQQYLLLFSRPPDVKRTTFRVEKHVETEDDRWLYLPGLDLVKRIAASDERTGFMGSHLFYEDLSGRSTVADKHSLEEVTETSYVIKSVPRFRGAVEFAEYTAWIDKSNFLPMKFEYKDDTGKLYRRITATKVEEFSGIPTVTEMKVEDFRSGGYTVIQMRFIKYDIALPDSIFSERSLRKPPMKWFARPGV